MNWKLIEVNVICPGCRTSYAISFWMKGLMPCLSFVCKGCGGRYKVVPPKIEEEVCIKCKRRIDCLVDTPFTISRFRVDHVPLDIWKFDPGSVDVAGEMRDCHIDDIRINGD